MSIETLKQHTNRKIEELTEKKAELHAKLQEGGILNYGWSILPDIAGVELELQDWNTIMVAITSTLLFHVTDIECANIVAERLSTVLDRGKREHCDSFYVPNGSNRMKNTIDLMELEYKPKRWRALRYAIELALE